MSSVEFDCSYRFGSGFQLEANFASDALVTALFGPSGSGKTTVLNLIAGLLRCDGGGTIHIGGERVDQFPPHRRGLGVVFQEQRLLPHLSVESNLRYGLRRQRGGERVSFDRAVAVLELAPLLARRPAQLSGGERQRVALGRAMLCQPRLLLMDEATTGLDDRLKLQILEYVERLVHEWHIPVLMITHSQVEVRRLAQRVVMIEGGRVTAQGPPEAVLTEPRALELGRELGVVNLLTLDELEAVGDRRRGRLHEQWLELPQSNDVPTPRFVSFASDAVLIASRDIADISARNHLRGVVRQVVPVSGGVFVGIDVGQMLWATVTEQAVRDLQLAPGSPVICLIKTQSLRLIG